MKEYKIQMFRRGEWMPGLCSPHASRFMRVTTEDDFAVQRIEAAKKEWESDTTDRKPTEWRILSREVSEWKPELHTNG